MTPRRFYDDDAQPPRGIYRERVNDRLVAELLGVCKGMVCDGVLTEGEVIGLQRWLVAHADAVAGYPGKVLAERLVRIVDDGQVSEEERRELQALLEDVTGETPDHNQPMNLASRAFFDTPPPTVLFDGQEYVFTGRLLYGTRSQCEKLVMDRGGRVAKMPTQATRYVVVGTIGSAAWIQSSYGTKLLRAADLRDAGCRIHIVPEEHWIVAVHEGG